MTAFDLKTTPGTSLGGFHYTSATATVITEDFTHIDFVRISPFAAPFLRLAFAALLTGSGPIALTAGDSYECNNCVPTREVTGGSVVAGGAPEPAAWALLVGGFGLAGFALRRRPAMAA